MKHVFSAVLLALPATVGAQELSWFSINGQNHYVASQCAPGSQALLFSSVHGGALLHTLPVGQNGIAELTGNSGQPPRMLLNSGAGGSQRVSYLPEREFAFAGAAIRLRMGQAELSWDAAVGDAKDMRFEILQSGDGSVFSPVASVSAVSGGQPLPYRFTAQTPGGKFYRIAVHSISRGTRYVSDILTLTTANPISVYPTAVSTEITVAMGGAEGSYRVIAQDGRTVARGNLKGARSSIPVDNLAPGVYIMQVQCLQEEKRVQFVKR